MRAFTIGFLWGVVFLLTRESIVGFNIYYFLIPAVFIFFILFKIKKYYIPFYIVLGFVFGASCSLFSAQNQLNDILKPEYNNQDLNVVGLIIQKPQYTENGIRFILKPENNKLPNKIFVNWYFQKEKNSKNNPPLDLNAGDKLSLYLRLKEPHGFYNEGGFDYEKRLFSEGIGATAYVRYKAGESKRLKENISNNIFIQMERLRLKIEKTFFAAFPQNKNPYIGTIIALSIGEQQAVKKEEWELFNKTAVTHLFSISGLHITLLSSVVAFVCAFLWRRVPFFIKIAPAPVIFALTSAVFALFYALLAGFGVPAQRTLYMLWVVAAAILWRRPVAISQVLAAAALVVLVFDPMAIFAIGFWLSFGTVAVLIFIGFSFWFAPHKSWGEKLWQGSFLFARTQIAASLVTLPVLLLVFQWFPLVSPISNALAIPLVTFLITPCILLATFFIFISTPIFQFLTECAHFFIASLYDFLHFCARIPVFENATTLPLAAVALIGVFLCCMPRGFWGKRLGFFFILPLFFYEAERPKENVAWVDFLDVGQGLAAVIRTQNHTLLFDTGPKYANNATAAERVIVPFLRKNQLTKIDGVVLSHNDLDHIGGFEGLKKSVKIQNVIDAQTCPNSKKWLWDGVEFWLFSTNLQQSTVNQNFFSDFQKNLPLTVENRQFSSNEKACLLKITAKGKSVLFTADIPSEMEAQLVQFYPNAMQSDVLQVAHHGSRFSTSESFLNAVAPKAAVVSAGYLNRYKHPSEVVVKRLKEKGIELFRTDLGGQIHVVLGDDLEIAALRKKHGRLWQHNVFIESFEQRR